MLAFIDHSVPKLFNERTAVLAVVLSLMAFFVSSYSPLNRRAQEWATAFYLPAIIIWWYFFHWHCFSFSPGIYYWGRPSKYSWLLNSGICYAFGFAFSLRLWRLSRGLLRVEGIVFAPLFLLLILSDALGEGPFMST